MIDINCDKVTYDLPTHPLPLKIEQSKQNERVSVLYVNFSDLKANKRNSEVLSDTV